MGARGAMNEARDHGLELEAPVVSPGEPAEVSLGVIGAELAAPQDSVSSVAITDRTPEDVVGRIVGRLNNPSNGYRVSRIDKMQRGRDAAKLAFIGQMDARAQRSREA